MIKEVKIRPEVDRAFDVLDANCVEWRLIRPSYRETLAMVFELSPDPLTSEAHAAMTALTRSFDSDPMIADAIAEYAKQCGQIYSPEIVGLAPERGAEITASERHSTDAADDFN
ncbi:hypothetical protein HFN78_14205 [Rhizobium laguerreae]|uniref:hypothetical protein n=1 Tax=Rhizobium laguerreae TaxID=1076926 RepID=UPI001C907064|nr:hypothetical protein [Rhizobium laguerreae]MBY3472071.1 hypothetical protein [Rhizobium laguerreae]